MQWLRRTHNRIQRARLLGLYALVAIVGLAWLGYGAQSTINSIDLMRDGETVEARVTSVVPDSGDDSRFVPTWEYRVDGERYSYTQDNPTVSPEPEIGDRRELLVDPDDPSDVTLPGFLGLWAGPIALLAFGVLAFLALAWRLRRRRR
jgi:hypothetical protein